MNAYRIRTATPADGAHFAALSESVAFRPETADPNRGYLVFQGSPREYALRIGECPHSVIAVDEADVPAAFLLAMPGTTIAEWAARGWIATGEQTAQLLSHPPEEFLLIDQIAVGPAARAAGLAQQMFDAVVAAAKPHIIGASIMHAPLRNLRSIRFFVERNGFSFVNSYAEADFEWGYYERKH